MAKAKTNVTRTFGVTVRFTSNKPKDAHSIQVRVVGGRCVGKYWKGVLAALATTGVAALVRMVF
ncbi:MAG: hypothetical protein K2V38_08420 [Gemmataceae bacterium]|nr:hypothetical protein [Gemmataceae bacterium]